MEDYIVPLETPCVYYDEHFMTQEEATAAYQELHQNTAWEKTAKINRWVALHEEESTEQDDSVGPYRYRDAPQPSPPPQQLDGNPDQPSTSQQQQQQQQHNQQRRPFTPTIRSICQKVQDWYNHKNSANVQFNVCLLNFYQDGHQRIGWHTDREEIGRTTPIASISLGVAREFHIRAKEGLERTSLVVQHGSLLVMENACQTHYVHCLPKMPHVTEGRINLTFRCKANDTPGEEEHDRRDKWLERITDIQQSATTTTANKSKKSSGPSNYHSYPTYRQGLADVVQGAGTATVFGDYLIGQEQENQLQAEQILDAMQVVYTVKTNIGAEVYAAFEVDELLNHTTNMDNDDIAKTWDIVPRPWGVAGYVAIGKRIEPSTSTSSSIKDHEKSTALAALLTLRSSQFVMEYHDHFDLAEVAAHAEMEEMAQVGGEELYQFYKQRLVAGTAKIPSLQQPAATKTDATNSIKSEKTKTTFRVTCERIGSGHNFQAPTVEFEIGGAMSEYFTNVKPKMEDYDVNIRVDVVANQVIVGTQQNFIDLSKRHFARYRNKVTLKSNIAYIMLRCANIQHGYTILDPFCGSGTILLEGLEIQPDIKCIGIDVNRRSVQGAEENAKAVGFGPDVCRFHCIDVRGFRKHVTENSVDAIVTNMPWGVMTGQNGSVSDLQSMYEIFLRTAWYVLKDHGRVVMFVLRGLQMTRIIRKLGGRYRILRVNVIRTTNNLPCIVVIEKLPEDLLNNSIKGQLAYMSQFVSVSKEIYHAIHNEDIASGIDAPEPPKRK